MSNVGETLPLPPSLNLNIGGGGGGGLYLVRPAWVNFSMSNIASYLI